MPDLAAGEAGEQGRLLGHRPPGLGDMVAVIQADADDLVRVWDHGCQHKVSQCEIRRRVRYQGRDTVERPGA